MATLKQRRAFNKIAENHGNLSRTMLEVGYSQNTAKKPQNLTESRGWQELTDQYLPDSLLTEKHRELLMARKKVRYFKRGELKAEYEELDTQAVSRGLDMAYKLKGKYNPEKSMTDNISVNIIDYAKKAESDRLIKEFLNEKREGVRKTLRDAFSEDSE